MDRPVLRYFGGKFMLAPWIISQMPPHRVYVEPFGGAASVLMQKPRSYAEVYNDLDDRIVNVFRVLQDASLSIQLLKKLHATPFARREFELASCVSKEPVEDARRTIIRSFFGFGADSVSDPTRSTGFRSNSNRSGTTPAHDWVNYAPALPAFTERLAGVVIENCDAFEMIEKFDSPETLFYLDPPYVTDTRKRKKAYRFELNDGDHETLLKGLKGLKGKVLLSGYDNPIYSALGWHCMRRNALSDGAGERVESLWFNPAAEVGIAQADLFRSTTDRLSGGELIE